MHMDLYWNIIYSRVKLGSMIVIRKICVCSRQEWKEGIVKYIAMLSFSLLIGALFILSL